MCLYPQKRMTFSGSSSEGSDSEAELPAAPAAPRERANARRAATKVSIIHVSLFH